MQLKAARRMAGRQHFALLRILPDRHDPYNQRIFPPFAKPIVEWVITVRISVVWGPR